MNRKKIVAGLLVITMLISGTMIAPKTAEAAETVDGGNGIEYILDDATYTFKKLWETKTAPVKEGCVFGGWYTKDENNKMVALTEVTAAQEDTAYAKFVPAYVLSIKAQNEEGTVKHTGEDKKVRSVRIISSVDSLFYQKVGFEILLNNSKNIGPYEVADVYSTLQNHENDEAKYANVEFGAASSHFSVCRIDDINSKNDGKIIYARPYWITMDGTKVEGLAKYVHIEDEYMNYISVPINLLTGEDVAAGTVELKYNSDVLSFHGFEAGRLMTEMDEDHATRGSVKIVGNVSPQDGTYSDVAADGIYANVRFSVNEGKTVENETFDMTVGEFYNWDEDKVETIKAWDVIYQ